MTGDFSLNPSEITDDVVDRIQIEAQVDFAEALTDRLATMSALERAKAALRLERAYDIAFRFWQKRVLARAGILLHVTVDLENAA